MARLLVWTTFLALAIALLHRVGGTLAPPPLAQPGELNHWLAQRDPAAAAFAITRLLVLAMAWYLLAATLVGVIVTAATRFHPAGPVIRAINALTLPLVRRLVQASVGVSVVTALLAGPVGPVGATQGEASSSTTTSSVGPPVIRRLPDAPSEPPPVAPTPALTPSEPAHGETWTVRSGDHFWSVAERTLRQAWGHPPSDREVDRYWRALVQLNVSMLRDAGNPDLIFPGQVMALPTVPTAPALTTPTR